MNRRHFVNTISTLPLLVLLDWHTYLQEENISKYKETNRQPLIRQVRLKTASPLTQLSTFYHQKLGFPIIEKQRDQIVFQAGQSQLCFQTTDATENPPFYHFAFNIPENKILEARAWQLKRNSIIQTPTHMIDKGFPKDVRHFRHWNAHSIFFWDPAGNLVEYIARHDLNNAATRQFSNKDILYISEIAFIVENVDQEAELVSNQLKIEQYRNGSANFRAMGDEMGLLLLMKKGRIWESQTNQAKTPKVFPTSVQLVGNSSSLQFNGYPYMIN